MKIFFHFSDQKAEVHLGVMVNNGKQIEFLKNTGHKSNSQKVGQSN